MRGILMLMLSCLPLLCIHLVHLLLLHGLHLLLLLLPLLLELLLLLHIVVLLLIVGLERCTEGRALLLLLAILEEMEQVELLAL